MTLWNEERTVPMSQAVRMLVTGFEWEAGLFLEVFNELSKRLSPEEAKEILAIGMYRTGLKLGEEARDLVEEDGPIGMAKAWDIIYGAGTNEAEQLDEERFIIRGASCAAFELFKRWNVPEETIRFFADAYCVGDVGHAEGFGKEDMDFQHTCRVMIGDEYCEWDFSTKPLEPTEKAVKKPDLSP